MAMDPMENVNILKNQVKEVKELLQGLCFNRARMMVDNDNYRKDPLYQQLDDIIICLEQCLEEREEPRDYEMEEEMADDLFVNVIEVDELTQEIYDKMKRNPGMKVNYKTVAKDLIE